MLEDMIVAVLEIVGMVVLLLMSVGVSSTSDGGVLCVTSVSSSFSN